MFERVLSYMPKDKAYEIWNLFLDFEKAVGDVETQNRVQKRKCDLYPELGSISIQILSYIVEESNMRKAIARFQYLDLSPCTQKQLDAMLKQG